jgi:pimeloyl-ACP methyl ester carboxylesterase
MPKVLFRAALVAALVLAACDALIPESASGPLLQPVFDPAAADLPVPNDLALRNGKVAIAPRDDLSAAENELKSSLNGKDGFSTASSIKVRFTRPASAASFTRDTVVALDLGEKGKSPPTAIEVSFEYAACDRSLTLVPKSPLLRGRTYLLAVRGGEAGVKGEKGEHCAPAPAFHFLRAGADLRGHPDALPGKTRAEKVASAEALEALRQRIDPYFQILEAKGLPRREVSVLWTFTASSGAEALFDPASKRIPMPNDLLRDPQTGLVALPIDPSEKPESQALKRGLSKLDGFSTTAAITVDATEPLDRTTIVAGKTVRLFRKDTLEEVTTFDASLSEDARRIVLEPRTPLRPATTYVAVIAGVKDTKQGPLGAMPLAALLALKNPLLAESGESAISSVCTDTARRLEPLRKAIKPVLDKLEATGALRADVAAAFLFTTQDIVKRAQALRAAPYEANLPLTVTDVINKSPFERGLGISMLSVARVITGKMTTVDFLDPVTRTFRDSGAGVPASIELLLTLPTGLKAGVKVPVVVFGHGLMTERRLALLLANRLAQSGFAMLTIDLPFHGERTACLADSHCESGATCAKDGVCLKGGKRADLSRIPNLWPRISNTWPGLGQGTPVATGQAFIDVENLFGARDHFRQAIVDLCAVTRLIKKGDFKPVTGGFALDGDRILYAGLSLGGIMGGAVAGVDPAYESMLLNVGGAGLPDLMRESTIFGPALQQAMESKSGFKKGTPEYAVFYAAFANAARWVFDEVDPVNLARFAVREPQDARDPETGQIVKGKAKRLRVQMAKGDVVVPNASTLRLLEATGVSKDRDFRAFDGSHGFLADPIELSYYMGQNDMAEFLEGKLP